MDFWEHGGGLSGGTASGIRHLPGVEVDRAASPETIEAAWRSLARRNHPDTATDKAAATERVKRLNIAHDWLSDSTRRERYDRAHAHERTDRTRIVPGRREPQSSAIAATGRLPRNAARGRTAFAIRAVIWRAQLLSADEVRRLAAGSAAREQDWDDAYDAVERWKARYVSEARDARDADRRRARVTSLRRRGVRCCLSTRNAGTLLGLGWGRWHGGEAGCRGPTRPGPC